jgi:hypothetical protein
MFGYMRIVNRQPLNVELLTLDDGTQKIAWDIKQLQSLLGISDLLHQEELSSSASTGVNSSGIPTIETVIAILDELGLKDLYEVRYRKQYATIIPKTDSKRPKVAMYVVQQQAELVLSIHGNIWNGYSGVFFWYEWDSYDSKPKHIAQILHIPVSEKPNFIARIREVMEYEDSSRLPILEENLYSTESSFSIQMPDNFAYASVLKDMCEQNICYSLTRDQRFPSTERISIVDPSHLASFLSELKINIKSFLQSNGEEPLVLLGYIPHPEAYEGDF